MDKTTELFLNTESGKQLYLNLSINVSVLFCAMIFLIGFSSGLHAMTGSVYPKMGMNIVTALFILVVVIGYGFVVLTIVSGAKYRSALKKYQQRTYNSRRHKNEN